MSKLVVLCSLLALTAAKPAFFAPGIFAPGLAYQAPLAYSAYPAALGPLSLAPGQPANILGADGRPLDTLDVNVAKAQHYAAKAGPAFHLLKKRSLAPLAVAPLATSVISPAHLPLSYHAPLTYHTPLAYSAYSYGPSLIRTW